MSTRTGYAVDQFSDAGEEVARLRAQALVVANVEDQAYLDAGLPQNGTGLDLGCGPGFVSDRLRQLRPELRLVGVDLDPISLRQARDSLRLRDVVRADARHLPFPSESFDLVFSRLVLRHIPEPDVALRDATRVLRPGGTLIVEDCDDGSIVLYPEPPGFAAVLQARHAALRRRGAEPLLARRLLAMLRNLSLSAVSVRALTVTTEDIGVEAFTRIVLMPAAEAIDDDLLPADTIRIAREAMAAWGASATSFGMTTLLVFRGTRQ